MSLKVALMNLKAEQKNFQVTQLSLREARMNLSGPDELQMIM